MPDTCYSFTVPRFPCLQDAGLLIGRKEHGAHHKAPFIAKYSIVSGWVNPWLDGECPGGLPDEQEALLGLLVG